MLSVFSAAQVVPVEAPGFRVCVKTREYMPAEGRFVGRGLVLVLWRGRLAARFCVRFQGVGALAPTLKFVPFKERRNKVAMLRGHGLII